MLIFFFFLASILNDNLLEGRVPEELYSIAVHGGSIEYVIHYQLAMITVFFSFQINNTKV